MVLDAGCSVIITNNILTDILTSVLWVYLGCESACLDFRSDFRLILLLSQDKIK